MGELHDVLFTGKIESSFSVDQVKNNFRKYLKVTDSQILKMFAGGNIYLKKGTTKEQCEAFSAKLQKIGAICYVVPSSLRISSSKKPAPNGLIQANNNIPAKLELVEKSVPVEAAPKPVVREAAIEMNPSAETVYVVYDRKPKQFGRLLEGVFFGGLGLFTILAFSPFPDGIIRRGFAIGLFFMLYGLNKLYSTKKH